jgi:hypothetical protein
LKAQHQKVCDTLKRLRSEADSAMVSWAVFESSNGYPIGTRRTKMRELINGRSDSWALSTVQNLAVRDTILTIHRMIDYSDSGKKSNVQSLTQIRQFLHQKDSLEFLVTEAKAWIPEINFEVQNEEIVRKLYQEVGPRLQETSRYGVRNLGTLRKNFAELRNTVLAHSLEGDVQNKPRLFEIRDGLVSVLVKKCSLMIAGADWDPKSDWKRFLEKAQSFWDRFENGLIN